MDKFAYSVSFVENTQFTRNSRMEFMPVTTPIVILGINQLILNRAAKNHADQMQQFLYEFQEPRCTGQFARGNGIERRVAFGAAFCVWTSA